MLDKRQYKLTSRERELSFNLAGLFSIRMLGIFIILPIYAEFAYNELNTMGFLAGMFIGSYALTQLIMQPIVGAISDRVGRKTVIISGLILFIIGSLIIAFTHNIYIAIFGRVIQGSGAISAVILALASDLTRPQIRSKVMAIIGISIGITFGISVVLSTLIYGAFQGTGIFLLCALFGVIGIAVVYWRIPSPEKLLVSEIEQESFFEGFLSSFSNRDINRLYFGAFMLHMILTTSFTGFPFFLASLGYGLKDYGSWKIYLPSFILSLIIMFLFVGFAERFQRHRILFLNAIAILILAFFLMFFELSYTGLFIAMTFFFIGFNVMEATQPSLMSRLTPGYKRGMMMGIFSSAQFLGASLGGIIGSMLYAKVFAQSGEVAAYRGIFIANIILLLGWFIIAYPMKNLILNENEENKISGEVE